METAAGLQEGAATGAWKEPHWVATLFPPRFTALDLLGETPHLLSERLACQRVRRRQEIYQAALQELQDRERGERRQQLSRMIRREAPAPPTEQPVSVVAAGDGHSSPASAEPGESWEEEECLWDAREVSALRRARRQQDSERQRLQTRLAEALAQNEREREARGQLQEALGSRERRLSSARKEIARRALHLDALLAEGLKKDSTLEAQAKEAREKEAELKRLNQELRNVQAEARELRQHSAGLASEIRRLRQEKEAGERRAAAAAAQAESEAAVRRLRQELEAVRAELEAERRHHSRSLNALELLRRHFASLPCTDAQDDPAARICKM